MHQAYLCVKIIIDVNSYFHVVQRVHKSWNNPRVLIHLSAIALQIINCNSFLKNPKIKMSLSLLNLFPFN